MERTEEKLRKEIGNRFEKLEQETWGNEERNRRMEKYIKMKADEYQHILEVETDMYKNLQVYFRKTIEEATPAECYYALSMAMKREIVEDWLETHARYREKNVKKVFYLSMEFLPGRILGNNLMNAKSYEIAKIVMKRNGFTLDEIEDQEVDAALGNGGLGRLAACFLESLSTLGYPAYGCGIRYRHGMFRQAIVDGRQTELPDDWLEQGYPFEVKRPEYTQFVRFGGAVRQEKDPMTGNTKFIHENYQLVKAIPYDVPIVGYGNGTVNSLRLWDAQPTDAFDLHRFNNGESAQLAATETFASDIVKVLYPDDNRYEGKKLRLKQQYFFVSASLQTIVNQYKKQNTDFKEFSNRVCLQLNDTHPVLAIPELMRILMDEEGLPWDEAWDITTHTCAFTNHTIMAEAMEKWPIDLFSELLPRIYEIVHEIDRRFVLSVRQRYPEREEKVEAMAILYHGHVRMANMAIISSFSVNGVAKLHTEILKQRELRDFYECMPDKFNNKTNGITQRRFLLYANPLLSNWITNHLGSDAWITDLGRLSGLKELAFDTEAQNEFMEIRYQNKCRLAEYIKKHNQIEVNPHSIFDVQVKRMHEYKRQLMNALRIMHLYRKLKQYPNMNLYPVTFIFGGKAAAAYKQAKLIIELIHAIADKVNHDSAVNQKIKVVFIENYRVSNAEIIFPASDVSEQISTASKEASGTGNMKFMLNGALTLGTLDGANIEIVEEVGAENAFLFGMHSQEVMEYEKNRNYHAYDIYCKKKEIRQLVDELADGTYHRKNPPFGEPDTFVELKNALLYDSSNPADRYFVLKDFDDYMRAFWEMNQCYRDKEKWAKMAILNTACAGKFSADRTIREYADEIWHIIPCESCEK